MKFVAGNDDGEWLNKTKRKKCRNLEAFVFIVSWQQDNNNNKRNGKRDLPSNNQTASQPAAKRMP